MRRNSSGVLLKIDVGICRTRRQKRLNLAAKKMQKASRIEPPKAAVRGRCPLPSRLSGPGELTKLPQWGPGPSPGQKRFSVHFELEKTPSAG